MKHQQISTLTSLILLTTTFIHFACVKTPNSNDPTHTVPEKAVILTNANFDSLILQPGTIAVVEFYSRTCETCAHMAWIIDSLASRKGNTAVIGVVDINTEVTLNDRYPIEGIPSYLFFKDGDLITQCSFSENSVTVLDSLTTLFNQVLLASQQVLHFTTSNFDSLLVAEQRLILIDFFSSSCSHCQNMEPIIDSLSRQLSDQVFVGKVNALENDSLRYRYTLQGFPSFLFFSEGIEVYRILGENDAAHFIKIADSLLQLPV